MKIDLPDEYTSRILTAVEHYMAYLKATNRDERLYLEVADFLKKKGQGKEESAQTGKKKRA